MHVLIGSRAIKMHFPDFPREPKDYDYAINYGDKPIIRKEGEVWEEYYPIPPITNRRSEYTRDVKVATPNELYTLKVSHIFWDIKWEKTMFDIVWLQKKGCVLDTRLLESLWEHWETVHGMPQRADLDMEVKEFFTNGIKNGHDHDMLHTFIKDPPTYTKILKDPNGVAIQEEKFWVLSLEDQLNIIREECYVMAYERMGEGDYRTAYLVQLKAWILHHGPSREMALFAVRHYDELRKPLINYKEVIDHGKSNI